MRADPRVRATSLDVIDAAMKQAERGASGPFSFAYIAALAVVGLGRVALALEHIASSLEAQEPRGRD